jgi:hypothetical protein
MEHPIQSDLTPSIQFSCMQGEANVIIRDDGTIEVRHPERIDEAAQQFLTAVSDHLKYGYVVRKKGVSLFLQVRMHDTEWVQNPEHATHFARQQDAEHTTASATEEVVPASKAMVF